MALMYESLTIIHKTLNMSANNTSCTQNEDLEEGSEVTDDMPTACGTVVIPPIPQHTRTHTSCNKTMHMAIYTYEYLCISLSHHVVVQVDSCLAIPSYSTAVT